MLPNQESAVRNETRRRNELRQTSSATANQTSTGTSSSSEPPATSQNSGSSTVTTGAIEFPSGGMRREGMRPVELNLMKVCMVCSGMNESQGSFWMQPCSCGYWVHERCLLDVVQHFEYHNPGTRLVGCRNCTRAFNIFPPKSPLLTFAEKASYVWYQELCDKAMLGLIIFGLDATFIKLGTVTLSYIYGFEETERIISSLPPHKAVFLCQMIPMMSIFMYSLSWEYPLLLVLRKLSRLPVLKYVLPLEDPSVPDIFFEHSTFVQCVIGGMMLPWCASLTSFIFIGFVDSNLHRFLLGGATFLAVKGVLQMYYKQKKYVRFCTLDVIGYNAVRNG